MDDGKGDEDDGASLSGTPVFLILRFKSLGWKQIRSSKCSHDLIPVNHTDGSWDGAAGLLRDGTMTGDGTH